MSNPRFVISRGNDHQFYFHLKAGNGEIIGHSEGYVQKQSAQNGIESVRTHSSDRDNFSLFQGKNDQFYFNLKARNGEIILASEGYVTKAGAENGIASVMTNAPTAVVVDVSDVN